MEPFRQLWIAVAKRILLNLQLETLEVRLSETIDHTLLIPAKGVRLIAVSVPSKCNLKVIMSENSLIKVKAFDSLGKILSDENHINYFYANSADEKLLYFVISNEAINLQAISLSLSLAKNHL